MYYFGNSELHFLIVPHFLIVHDRSSIADRSGSVIIDQNRSGTIKKFTIINLYDNKINLTYYYLVGYFYYTGRYFR